MTDLQGQGMGVSIGFPLVTGTQLSHSLKLMPAFTVPHSLTPLLYPLTIGSLFGNYLHKPEKGNIKSRNGSEASGVTGCSPHMKANW
jgi:hypothetical protein